MVRRWHSILLLLQLMVLLALSQAPPDPLKNFCRRYGQQTAILDNKLYIDGGWLYANPISENPVPTINQGLLYSDLKETTDGMPTQFANLTKNSSVPDVAGGVLWQDNINKVFWLYGGEYSTAPSSFQMWGYDTILNQWNLTSPAMGTSSSVQRVSYGAGVAISESGLGFYYGGYLNSNTNPLWTAPQMATSNLIIYDFDDNTLYNNTAYDSTGRAEGTMVYIPTSGAGLLVYFGGVTFPYGNETEVAAPMDQILLYDIGDAKWTTQTATGDMPGSRRKFCGGVTWASDQSSYNVYIYGGFGFGETAGYDDVYILSMPSFSWVRWYPTEPGPSSPHGWLTCNVVNSAQMIVMGGNFTNITDCDVPSIQAQHNLDLNAKWKGFEPNVTEYLVPKAVIDVAGGSPQGGATVKSPSNGWDDPRVNIYFGQRATYSARAATRAFPSHTAAPLPPPPKPKKKNNTGAIAGGAVGGAVVLILIAGLVWFCMRKRSRSRKAASTTGTGPENASTTTTQYVMGEKYSVGSPHSSRVASPSRQIHQHQDSIHQMSPYTTPPPIQPDQQYPYPYYHPHPGAQPQPMSYYPYPMHAGQPQPYHHPAHGPQPMAYYMPPNPQRPDIGRELSHEMPAIKSPEITEVHQPSPMRPDEGNGFQSPSESQSDSQQGRDYKHLY